MRLFDDFERTYTGRIDQGELLHSFFNRSAQPEAAHVRRRCEEWFTDYVRDAKDCDVNDFRSRFLSNKSEQFHAVWFELCVHQMLVRLGFSVSVHPNLPGTKKHPDFVAISDGSRILVEATIVAPESTLSPFEKDAQHKFLRLRLENFFASITKFEGTLDRFLTRSEIYREFREFFAAHNPNEVQRLVNIDGYSTLPTKRIPFGNWILTVELWPSSPGHRNQSEGRVISSYLDERVDPSVRRIQVKIKNKKQTYGPTGGPLILAVNVHALEFNPIDHGKQVLFDTNGIWNRRRLSRPTVTGVVFFAYADSVSLQAAGGGQAKSVCLFVNPLVDPGTLPPPLLRLPRVQGPDGSERHDGESVASILGLV